LESVVHEMANKIVSDFPLEGYVVRVDTEGKQISIDLGKEMGVKAGMYFLVYQEGEEIRHPITDEVLNIEKVPVATVRVVSVGPKTSRCAVASVQEGRTIAYGQRIASAEGATLAGGAPALPVARARQDEQKAPAAPVAAAPSVAPPAKPEISIGAPGCLGRQAKMDVPQKMALWRSLAQWTVGAGGAGFLYPVDVAVDPQDGTVYVLDLKKGTVECLNPQGVPLRRFDAERSAPMGIAVGPSGDVWVAATYRHQIMRFDHFGNVTAVYGRAGRGTGELLVPSALALDRDGNILVTEIKNERVQKFDSNGNSLWVTGSPGREGGQFAYPAGIAVEDSGAFYVSDRKLGRVDAFDAQGAFLKTLITGLEGPSALHLTKTRELLVTETGRHRVLVIDTNGKVLEVFGKKGRDVGDLYVPFAAGGLGRKIFVADTGNRRVQVFER
jgi:DNA-binding beta-propeller fold protein YncE